MEPNLESLTEENSNNEEVQEELTFEKTTDEIDQETLVLLGELEVWDKLYIDKDQAQSQTWSFLQPVTRKMWNFCFGGADRKQLLTFLETLYYRVFGQSEYYMNMLSKPYVMKNYTGFHAISDSNSEYLESLKKLNNILPQVSIGLSNLTLTYQNDESTCLKLNEIIVHFQKLQDDTRKFVAKFD